jgi:hypothetical protein
MLAYPCSDFVQLQINQGQMHMRIRDQLARKDSGELHMRGQLARTDSGKLHTDFGELHIEAFEFQPQ